MEKIEVDSGGPYYGPEVVEIFAELAKSIKLEKMTDTERHHFQDNLKRLIDCESIKFNIKMEMISRVVYFPREVLVGMYSFRNGIETDYKGDKQKELDLKSLDPIQLDFPIPVNPKYYLEQVEEIR
jgi:hypothetical protein